VKKKIIIAVAVFLVVALVAGGVALSKNPRTRLLFAVLHFSEQTLQDADYIMYGVDAMEICRDYLDGDIAVDGRLTLSKLKNLSMSMYSNVSLTRSFEQKKMFADCEVETLLNSVGDMELYAKDQTFYIVVPMLDDMAFAFPTDLDLFMKMPDLTSDVDRSWFRENYGNIVELVRQMKIEKAGDTIVDSDGTVSVGYRVTVPQGTGSFIWELLGMEQPDYDVAATVYLTQQNHLRRIVVDMEKTFPGAVMTLEGENARTAILTYELPGDERIVVTAVRNSEHTNWMDIECVYDTNTDTDYVFTAALTWERTASGYDIWLRDMLVKYGTDIWARGSFKGTITPQEQTPDVFGQAAVDLDSLDPIDWKALRDNADGFVDDILTQIEEKTGLSLFR
jgi:hypothetical protein